MSQRTSRRALLVEDDAPIRELLRLHLDLAGFAIEEAEDGRIGLDRARAAVFDIILLDVMLPGLDGVSVCRAIRAAGSSVNTPILMLTARDGESDKVLGLESGADDYLTKPFGVRELMARVSALMRRHQRQTEADVPPTVVHAGALLLDRERRQATVRGERIDLTKQEFDLLLTLASRPGAVFTRAALLEEVWSDDTFVTDRTVDTVVSRLRRKIERDPQDPEMLLTAWGVGVDTRLERSDIRLNPSNGRVSADVPLALQFVLSRVSADGACVILPGAQMDIWHCDALGVYSDVTDRRSDTRGQQFLRGYQVSDSNGLVRFTTIYPGWYPGRAVHVHFKIRVPGAQGVTDEFTSQLYFADALTDRVHAGEPYNAKKGQRLLNSRDMIFRESGTQLILPAVEAEGGFAATYRIAMRPALSRPLRFGGGRAAHLS